MIGYLIPSYLFGLNSLNQKTLSLDYDTHLLPIGLALSFSQLNLEVASNTKSLGLGCHYVRFVVNHLGMVDRGRLVVRRGRLMVGRSGSVVGSGLVVSRSGSMVGSRLMVGGSRVVPETQHALNVQQCQTYLTPHVSSESNALSSLPLWHKQSMAFHS